MKSLRTFGLSAALLCFGIIAAFAQQGPAKVNQPWHMLARLTSAVSVTVSSAPTALPSLNGVTPAGLIMWACNTGSNDAYLTLGNANTITTSTTTGDYLKAGTCAPYDLYPPAVAAAYSYVALIGSGSTTVTIETGIGQPPAQAAAGGGGSVTQGTTPWIVGGNVGGFDFQLSACSSGCDATLTVQNAAYSAGNSEGGLITVTGAARINGGSGILNGLRLKSAGGSTNTIWVYAWDKTPASTCTDKSAFVANAADQANALADFPISLTLGGAPGSWDTSTYAHLPNAIIDQFKNKDTSPGTALYLCLVTAGSVTPATTADLSMVLGGIQD